MRVGLRVWLLRLVWVTLPLTAGGAVADAIAGWSDAPRITATVLCWLAWGGGLVAVLAPRPESLTVLRIVAPALAVAAVVVAVDGAASDLATVGALVATLAAAVLAADHEIALASAAAVAYGDELRYPLRVPPGLFLGPLWIVRAFVVGAVVAAPLLLADGRIVWGLVALLLGVPIVVLGARSLHALSRRWFVIVPAGVVVVDPLTLSDPILLVRRLVRRLRTGETAPPPGALDLRLGASLGTLVLELDEEIELMRATRGRRGGEMTEADVLVIAVVRHRDAIESASRRKVRIEAV